MSTLIILLIIIAVLLILYFLFGSKNNPESKETDAKRFAKLLVGEIKLFETYKFGRGLKNNNLYESLQDEIEEARKKYKKRFPSAESEVFFEEAILNILANDDKAKLGLVKVLTD